MDENAAPLPNPVAHLSTSELLEELADRFAIPDERPSLTADPEPLRLRDGTFTVTGNIHKTYFTWSVDDGPAAGLHGQACLKLGRGTVKIVLVGDVGVANRPDHFLPRLEDDVNAILERPGALLPGWRALVGVAADLSMSACETAVCLAVADLEEAIDNLHASQRRRAGFTEPNLQVAQVAAALDAAGFTGSGEELLTAAHAAAKD